MRLIILSKKKIAVINGPNINILGNREPGYYGTTTLPEIEAALVKIGCNLGYEVVCFQSNYQGKIVDYIQDNYNKIDGVILNPAGFSKIGYPILDALTAYNLPFIEIHLSNIFAREKWHQESIFSNYSVGFISGLKSKGYELAIEGIIDYLEKREKLSS